MAYKPIKGTSINNKYNMHTSHFEHMDKEAEAHILKRMNDLAKDIHHHQSIHGGKLNISKAFKHLGHSITSTADKAGHAISSATNKAVNYVDTPSGLASDIVKYGIPATTSALGGITGTLLAPETGGLSSVVGSAMGAKLGSMLAAKAAGKGMQGRGPVFSKNKYSVTPITNAEEGRLANLNAAQQHLVTLSERDKERLRAQAAARALAAAQKKAGNKVGVVNEFTGIGLGAGIKGSQEAKERMARVRAHRK
jgi:hypothetical protein